MVTIVIIEVKGSKKPCCHTLITIKFLYELDATHVREKYDPWTCVALARK